MYRLVEDFHHPKGFVVPNSFLTDGATIPRVVWTALGITPYDPRVIVAALGHDWLFDVQCVLPISFEEANELLYVDLISEGISEEIAYLIYTAVEMFGRSHYRNN